jgi:hypothetical protein
MMMARGSTAFEVGDEVLAIADRVGVEQMKQLFSAPNGE